MVDFAFYKTVYGGTQIPEEEFATFAARADDLLAYYGRVYRVSAVPGAQKGAEMAACAMAESLYRTAKAQDAAGSVSVGSVSCGAVQQPSAPEKMRELLHCCERYLRIYRGARGGL